MNIRTNKKIKSMYSNEKQESILKKMKDRLLKVGSGIPNKKYLVLFN